MGAGEVKNTNLSEIRKSPFSIRTDLLTKGKVDFAFAYEKVNWKPIFYM
jgi:hypothetical protein